jgi:hypothetical protein
MGYTSSNDVFDAVGGQIDRFFGGEVDSVVIFDGELWQAIEQRANESGIGDVTIFIGMPQTTPERLDGCGLPLREDVEVDIYVIVRASGRSRYTASRELLWDITDQMVHSVFTCTERSTDFKSVIMGWAFNRRIRMDANPDYLAHKVEFTAKPVR